MPLVASGEQGWSSEDVMRPLVEAAAHWMRLGLPLGRLAIVERHPGKAQVLADILSEYDTEVSPDLDTRLMPPAPKEPEQPVEAPEAIIEPDEADYDAFISYSHENAEQVHQLVALLEARDPSIRLFFDRHELGTGVAWLERIADALDRCRKIVAIFTPEYFASRWCKAELNTALLRENRSDDPILFPIYLLSSEVPTLYLARQYLDCREADADRLEQAATELVSTLR